LFGHLSSVPRTTFSSTRCTTDSIFLIVFSYLTNQWLVGIFVLFVHGSSDFALILARSYKVIFLSTQDYKHYYGRYYWPRYISWTYYIAESLNSVKVSSLMGGHSYD
jgi:hypothetical protein